MWCSCLGLFFFDELFDSLITLMWSPYGGVFSILFFKNTCWKLWSWCSTLSARQMVIFSLRTWVMAAGVLSSAGSRKASRFKHHNSANVARTDSLKERFSVESRLPPPVQLPAERALLLHDCSCQRDWVCLTSLTSAGLPTTGKGQTNKDLWKFTHSPLSARCLVD